MEALYPQHWKEYQLLDAGNFRKLERFGDFVLDRPEPQAVWKPKWSEKEWGKQAHVVFTLQSNNRGEWKKTKQMPDQWKVRYKTSVMDLTFRLGLTAFKHVGVFPEQAANWDYIYDAVKGMKQDKPRVLNLFAYTGGASLAARAAGADVVHVDSIKQVISWARQNMELSSLSDIRWTVEDALKFVKREVKRGHKYHGVILDPPAYGHGPSGEKWKLEEQINELMSLTTQLLEPQEHFFIINLYSLGFSPIIVENLICENTTPMNLEAGELYIPSKSGVKLPLGVFGRFKKLQ